MTVYIHSEEGSTQRDEDSKRILELLTPLLSKIELHVVADCYLAGVESNSALTGAEGSDLFDELIDGWTDPRAVIALKAKIGCGFGAKSSLERFLSSGDPGVRISALKVCENRSDILKAINDEDCKCRKTVLDLLAEKATAVERSSLLALGMDPSAYVRKHFAIVAGENCWTEAISVLVRLLGDNREFGERNYGDDHQVFEVAREASRSLRSLNVLEKEGPRSVIQFLGKCEKASKDTTVHASLFQMLPDCPTKESFEFCSVYFEEFWLTSQWNVNRGHRLLQECFNAIAEMLLKCPEFSEYIPFETFESVAAWDDDEHWLVGAALAVLALSGTEGIASIEKIAQANSFNEDRARILIAGSKPVCQGELEVLIEHVAERHPLNILAGWIRDQGKVEEWERFLEENRQVSKWLGDLDICESTLSSYERWMVGQLVKPFAPNLYSDRPPSQFS